MRVAFDVEYLGYVDGAGLGDAADVVASEVEEHDVFGALFLVNAEVFFQSLSSASVAPRGLVPAMGWTATVPSTTCTRQLRRSADNWKPSRSR